MPVTPFQKRVYALLSQIPAGRVTTYAAIARALHTSPRAVGNALRNNPYAPRVPCHRCVAASGYINGYNGEVVQRTTFKRTKGGKSVIIGGKVSQSRGKVSAGLLKELEAEIQKQGEGEGEGEVVVKTVPPSGVNVSKKMALLMEEGVLFDDKGMLLNSKKVMFDGPWEV